MCIRDRAEELQKVYAEIGFNPITGCLPLLIQMPIFVALFQVLQEMGGRTEGMIYSFYSILPTLIDSPSAVFSQGFMQFIPYGILLLLFAFCTFLPSVLQQRGTNNPQKNQMLIMMGIMSLFMLWLGWTSPVSYTHLDVYKRQVSESSRQRNIATCLGCTIRRSFFFPIKSLCATP